MISFVLLSLTQNLMGMDANPVFDSYALTDDNSVNINGDNHRNVNNKRKKVIERVII